MRLRRTKSYRSVLVCKENFTVWVPLRNARTCGSVLMSLSLRPPFSIISHCTRRGREDICPFFELLGPEGCAQLEVAVMDMSVAYEQEVRAHCPQAAIVYDLFHIVAKYGREVIDRSGSTKPTGWPGRAGPAIGSPARGGG